MQRSMHPGEALRVATIAACALVFALGGSPARAGPVEDGFIAGYATAILERDFALSDARVSVQDGVVRLRAGELAGIDRQRAVSVLRRIRGVVEVEVEVEGADAAPPPPAGPAPPSQAPPVEVATATAAELVLPRRILFEPLLADPRWPHFAAAYQRYMDETEIENSAAVSFGETFGLYQRKLDSGGSWQIGFQAGVFAVFDLDASSQDLINADYFVGVPVSYRSGRFSALARVFHQSSHLGDEFLLRGGRERINLSYQAVDLKLSYDVLEWLRLYGGGGLLFGQEPSDLRPWSTQFGAEVQAPFRIWSDSLRPVAALDVQNRDETDWNFDVSLRAGLQLESSRLISQRIQLMLEYYNGHSPNGQFFTEDIEYVGLGIHVFF